MPDPLPTMNAHLSFALKALAELEHHPDTYGVKMVSTRQACAISLHEVARRIAAGDIVPDMERILRGVLREMESL